MGDYDVHSKCKGLQRNCRLANGFNSMIQAIKKRDEELLFSNEELKLRRRKITKKI